MVRGGKAVKASMLDSAQARALDSFVKLLRAAYWASHRAGVYRQRAGLTETQFAVLEALYHKGRLAQVDIAGKLLSSPSNLTLVLDNLERDGLISRSQDPDDRRRQIVDLSLRGRERIAALFPVHAAGIARLMSALTESEQEDLGRLCRKLGLSARDQEDD